MFCPPDITLSDQSVGVTVIRELRLCSRKKTVILWGHPFPGDLPARACDRSDIPDKGVVYSSPVLRADTQVSRIVGGIHEFEDLKFYC